LASPSLCLPGALAPALPNWEVRVSRCLISTVLALSPHSKRIMTFHRYTHCDTGDSKYRRGAPTNFCPPCTRARPATPSARCRPSRATHAPSTAPGSGGPPHAAPARARRRTRPFESPNIDHIRDIRSLRRQRGRGELDGALRYIHRDLLSAAPASA
jgi:hypothetical protein